MSSFRYPFIRLTACFATGILTGFYAPVAWQPLLIALCAGLAGLYLFYKKDTTKTLFGALAFTTTFLAGWFNVVIHSETHHPHHYSQHLRLPEAHTLQFSLSKKLKPTERYERYEIRLHFLDTTPVSGKLLLHVEKEGAQPLQPGGLYRVSTALHGLTPPLNPHQFHYKNYLERKQLYHQLYVAPSHIYTLPQRDASFFTQVAAWRERINQALQQQGFGGDELAVIKALLIGQQEDISGEVYERYANSGAIHILAVSGLHVGIFAMLLNGLFSPLERFRRGRTLKLVLLVSFLWLFALLAGMSASVVRSVAMFSFITWAIHLKRATHIYNTLAISMFFLLLYKPSFLFDVGFQLSYAAVFSIVWIQPMLYKKWSLRYPSLNFFWKLLSVTLAAQVVVTPISLYYFHQFPGLFFLSNLVVLPFMGVILGGGLLVVALALSEALPPFLANGYAFLIRWMNYFVEWVSSQETFLFKDIPFRAEHVALSYILICSGIWLLKKPAFSRVCYFLAAVLAMQGIFIFHRYKTSHTERFIVFHKTGKTLIGLQDGAHFTLHAPGKSVVNSSPVQSYRVAEEIETTLQAPLENSYRTPNGKSLFLIDSAGVYQIAGLHPHYLLLSHSPRINMERVLQFLRPAVVIADGSNYRSDVARWKSSCEKHAISFHATAEKGAWVFTRSR